MSKFFAEGNISDDSDDSDDRQDQPANKAQKNKFGDIVNSVFYRRKTIIMITIKEECCWPKAKRKKHCLKKLRLP